MPTYRVTFVHVHQRTKFTVDLVARDAGIARGVAESILRRKFRMVQAGPEIPWRHLETQEQKELDNDAPTTS